ncbi:hypothetical protein BH09PLA1_BH09PLA1_30850 [soil metagenome]
MSDSQNAIRMRVRQVLLSDWDDSSDRPDRFDLHIDALIDVIRRSSDAAPIVEFLHEREKESMCFPSLGTARLMPVARKLLALRDDLV